MAKIVKEMEHDARLLAANVRAELLKWLSVILLTANMVGFSLMAKAFLNAQKADPELIKAVRELTEEVKRRNGTTILK